MDLLARMAAPQAASTRAQAPRSTSASQTTPLIFETPSLTTTFTPAPECTSQHLTMLQSDAFKVWLNEPLPVPNTTISSCYPKAFMTSYLQSRSNTIGPAFSPLVCPQNYQTVFNQTSTDRPLYVACCPSSFGFAPPSQPVPGRPAFGGTCFSNILSTTVTQYDNSSSSGVMTFTTSGQAFAHPIDGFAFTETSTTRLTITSTNGVVFSPETDTVAPTGPFPTSVSPTSAASSGSSSPDSATGATSAVIAGSVGAVVGTVALLTAVFLIWRRSQQKKRSAAPIAATNTSHRGAPSTPHYPQNPNVYPYLSKHMANPSQSSVRTQEKALPQSPPKYYQAYRPPPAASKPPVSEMHSSFIQEMPSKAATPPPRKDSRTSDASLLAPVVMQQRPDSGPKELAAGTPSPRNTTTMTMAPISERHSDKDQTWFSAHSTPEPVRDLSPENNLPSGSSGDANIPSAHPAQTPAHGKTLSDSTLRPDSDLDLDPDLALFLARPPEPLFAGGRNGGGGVRGGGGDRTSIQSYTSAHVPTLASLEGAKEASPRKGGLAGISRAAGGPRDLGEPREYGGARPDSNPFGTPPPQPEGVLAGVMRREEEESPVSPQTAVGERRFRW